jgi:hypothetical protein
VVSCFFFWICSRTYVARHAEARARICSILVPCHVYVRIDVSDPLDGCGRQHVGICLGIKEPAD